MSVQSKLVNVVKEREEFRQRVNEMRRGLLLTGGATGLATAAGLAIGTALAAGTAWAFLTGADLALTAALDSSSLARFSGVALCLGSGDVSLLKREKESK